MSGDPCEEEFGAGEGCETRYLDMDAAAAARASVTPGGREVVTFTCPIFGRTEAVLIGDGLANELAGRQSSVDGIRGARVLASLEHSALCACDVATLLGVPQRAVEQDLARLAAAGLVASRPVDAMPVYAVTDSGRRALDALTAPVVTTLRLDLSECASCVGSLNAAIRAVEGVGSVSVDAASGVVRVQHDHDVTRSALEAAAAAVGIRVAATVDHHDDDAERP